MDLLYNKPIFIYFYLLITRDKGTYTLDKTILDISD